LPFVNQGRASSKGKAKRNKSTNGKLALFSKASLVLIPKGESKLGCGALKEGCESENNNKNTPSSVSDLWLTIIVKYFLVLKKREEAYL
jgi:hypothetical protein